MNKVLFLGGPTGIGKSDVAVQLALRYNACIISADSMQIYKGLNIGTGKISQQEMYGIPHAMIDIVSPDSDYSAQNYYRDATELIQQAHQRGQLPIVVGGTGLYLHTLINEPNFAMAKPDPQIREKYTAIYHEKGAEYMHDLLRSVDRQAAEHIAVNDIRRTIRALEIHAQTGKNKSDAVSMQKCPYAYRFYVLTMDRDKLYQRINLRVDNMIQNGLVKEIQQLQSYWNCRCMEAIGYKEIISALQHNSPVNDSVIEQIKQNSRRYAKRQISFFKWIPAKKTYIGEDFYENITTTSDQWLKEGSI